jgi:hypothetical protein
MLEPLRPARVFHHAVERDELGNDDSAHPVPSFRPKVVLPYSTIWLIT